MRALSLLCLIVLTGCATPRQSCERDALEDLRVVDALIAETERTLARGYALGREPYSRPSVNFCYGYGGYGRGYYNGFGMSFCGYPEIAYREVPMATDLNAERAKLAELKRKRIELDKRAARDLAACRQRFPEG